jgi:cytochrome-b5 reductase
VTLERGFSMMDWIRLTKSGKDLTGVGGCRVNGKIREVTRSELKKHRKRNDAWMALNGVNEMWFTEPKCVPERWCSM